jgi:hypothetical protein
MTMWVHGSHSKGFPVFFDVKHRSPGNQDLTLTGPEAGGTNSLRGSLGMIVKRGNSTSVAWFLDPCVLSVGDTPPKEMPF